MKKIITCKLQFILILFLFLVAFSCHQEKNSNETTFEDLFYKTLKCTIKEYNTLVYFYSPHIIGIWVNDKTSKIEYFRSLGFSAKENALFFESVIKGKNNYQTKLSVSSNKNKRIKIVIEDNTIKLIAIKKLDGNNKPIAPLLYSCEIGKNIYIGKN